MNLKKHTHSNPIIYLLLLLLLLSSKTFSFSGGSGGDDGGEETPLYRLSVLNGSGSGQFKEGQRVSIFARTPRDDETFLNWGGDGAGFINNINSINTIIIIPDRDVQVIANYETEGSDNGGNDSGDDGGGNGDDDGGNSGGDNGSSREPYLGDPLSIPGTIEAEYFDIGDIEDSYSDFSINNEGDDFRQDTSVDIYENDSGFQVGKTEAGEWLEYTVNVAHSQEYFIIAKAASLHTGGQIQLQIDGNNIAQAKNIIKTHDWRTYDSFALGKTFLSQGEQVLRLNFVTESIFNPNGYVGDLDKLQFIETIPYKETLHLVPGSIEAEFYDYGEDAFKDSESSNRGGELRNDSVDVFKSSSGYKLGGTRAGEFVQYTLKATKDATYYLYVDLASARSGGELHFELNDEPLLETVQMPNTGSFSSFKKKYVGEFDLDKGIHTLKLVFDKNAENDKDIGDVDRIYIADTKAEEAPAKPKIIFETDATKDIDDLAALAMLHELHRKGEIELIAVMQNTDHRVATPCLNNVNRYKGHPNIPIGVLKSNSQNDTTMGSDIYLRNCANKISGALSYNRAKDAVTLYKEILSAHPDNSITIVNTGFLNNMRNLIRSSGGKDLVRRKIHRAILIGGDHSQENRKSPCEFNFCREGRSAITKFTMDNWPGKIVFIGAEVARDVLTGSRYHEQKSRNPVAAAYCSYPKVVSRCTQRSWDQAAVLYAARGAQNHFTVKTFGYNEFDNSGRNTWKTNRDNPDHIYLKRRSSTNDMRRAFEALMY